MWGFRKGYVNVNDQQEDYVDDLFCKLKAQFVDHGVPVILGKIRSYLSFDDKL